MRPSVCVVRQSYYPADAHVYKNVLALVEAGFTVDVICQREKGAKGTENFEGGSIYRLPLMHKRGNVFRYFFEYAAFFIMAFCLLAYRSLRHRYDIVDVYNVPDFLAFATLPAKLRGSKIILYLFEMMPEQVAYDYGLMDSHLLLRILRWLERRSVRFADRVITVSPHQKAIIEQRSSPKVEPTVCLNVPEEKLFSERNSVSLEDSGCFRVVTHGSLLRRYGIETLIRAVSRLRREIPGLEVWIIGEGEYRPALEALARELGIEKTVRFTGWLSLERVPEYIARADVGVVPISAFWLLPNKLFEYVAMGKPVAASESPAIRAVFSEDDVAYFKLDDDRDLAEKIVELYRDRPSAERLAQNALKTYERYRWQVVKDTYVAVHTELTSTAPQLQEAVR